MNKNEEMNISFPHSYNKFTREKSVKTETVYVQLSISGKRREKLKNRGSCFWRFPMIQF